MFVVKVSFLFPVRTWDSELLFEVIVLAKKGISYGQLAGSIGLQEQRVIDICTGNAKPTESEFKSLASALGLSDVPHTGYHTTA